MSGFASTRCGLACLALCIASESAKAIVIADNRNPSSAVIQNLSTEKLSGVGFVSNSGSCSGTPIAANVILSAAHCFKSVNNPSFYISYSDQPNVYRTISNVVTHPSYTGAVTSAGDIALAFLSDPLPSYVPTYSIASFNTVPTGAVVTFAGYGNTGTGSTGQISGTVSSNTKRFGLNEIDTIFNGGAGFASDFDTPTECTKLGCTNLLGNLEALTAQGDSGGPAFYNPYIDLLYHQQLFPANTVFKPLPDIYSILGVTSYGSRFSNQAFSSYGTTAGYTFAGFYRDWIANLVPNLSITDFASPIFPAGDANIDVRSLQELPLLPPVLISDLPPTEGVGSVPEPTSIALLVGNIAALAALRWLTVHSRGCKRMINKQ